MGTEYDIARYNFKENAVLLLRFDRGNSSAIVHQATLNYKEFRKKSGHKTFAGYKMIMIACQQTLFKVQE